MIKTNMGKIEIGYNGSSILDTLSDETKQAFIKAELVGDLLVILLALVDYAGEIDALEMWKTVVEEYIKERGGNNEH